MFKKNYLFIIIITALSSCSLNKQMAKTSNLLLQDSSVIGAHIGIGLYNYKTSSYVLQNQSNKLFVPASNTKIITCYAGLKYLGDSLLAFEYIETPNELLIKGVGNPTLLHPDFKEQNAVNWLKNHPSKKIGLVNSFQTTGLGSGWSWDDYQETYMAERSFLPLYGNMVFFEIKNEKVIAIPSYFNKNITSSFESSDGNLSFEVNRSLGKNEFAIVPGTNKNAKELNFTTFASNPLQSNQLVASLLADTLQKQVYPSSNKQFLNPQKIYSGSTDSMLKIMMHRSDNFLAEQTLQMVSNAKLGLLNEDKIIDNLFKTDFYEIPQKPRWVDGSGLSRYNLFTPEDFIWILNKTKQEFSWNRIKSIYPTGNEGTLKGLYKLHSENIVAKTGTLSNQVALSGFIITKKGNEYTFSILVNNHTSTASKVRKAIETFLSKIIEQY
jgi:D-alanyl-D-alanine carboxypeptidase/D-alanyl-D-alanine-endopeptidase (penicillin-binding protein 4)